jgi:hypothetical protein
MLDTCHGRETDAHDAHSVAVAAVGVTSSGSWHGHMFGPAPPGVNSWLLARDSVAGPVTSPDDRGRIWP